jgi:hypothetical protein
VETLKLLEDEHAQSLLRTARTALYGASALNTDGRAALEQFPPRDNALILIKRSLETLAETYQAFFELSEATQKFVPQNN